jgi:hypothetical protein
MEPYLVTENALGFRAIRIHYSADPEKDPNARDPAQRARAEAWLRAQREAYPDPNDFAREMEINWTAGYGSRVFPEFTDTHHAVGQPVRRGKTLYRAWDFGWHTPALLIAQIDAQGRLCLIQEVIGDKKTTHDFASDVVARCGRWYPNHSAGFEDFCDPAGQQIKSMESENNERRDVEVLAGLGISAASEYGWSRKDARTLVHRLLTLRHDGTPSLVIDPAGCPLTTQAFLGRYVYPPRKDGNPRAEPDDETHPWADLMACVRYLVIGLHRKLGLMRYAFAVTPSTPREPPVYQGYGTPVTRRST